jgi:hypothetical protein
VLKPILITGGHAVVADGAGFHVPKPELVAVVQLLLQARRLEVPASILEQKTLEGELLAFRARITLSGAEKFEAGSSAADDWRSRPHDDLVLALAIAGWLGERLHQPEGSVRPRVFQPAGAPWSRAGPVPPGW